ncbi:hypothetical protein KM043_006927 [Ampulex compressa]|nr:hypothetical protein KM043_006927 [Ampulex compressa]
MELGIALRALAFSLVLQETYGYSQEWYENPVRRQVSFQSPSRSNSEEKVVRRLIPDPKARSGGGMQNDGKIFFPGFGKASRSLIGLPNVCEGSTFCEETPDYPEDVVNTAILSDSSLLHYANVDAVDAIAQRIDIADAEPLCISIERVVYPKSAESMSKVWLYVVNQANFTQGVRIETCSEEDSSCKVIDGFAQGYITACKQKYIYRQLSAISPEGTIIREFFRFPASCCCHVQFTGAEARMSYDGFA